MCLLPPQFYSKNWISFLFCWKLGAWSRQEGCEVPGCSSSELTVCSVNLVKEGSQWPPDRTWRRQREGERFGNVPPQVGAHGVLPSRMWIIVEKAGEGSATLPCSFTSWNLHHQFLGTVKRRVPLFRASWLPSKGFMASKDLWGIRNGPC